MTLAEFLLARIAEDELDVAARRPAVDPGPGFVDTMGRPILGNLARALAECEAKRRIVGLHGPVYVEGNPRDEDGWPGNTEYCRGCNANFDEEWASLLDDCPTKRALAQPYADHPDFDPAWAQLAT